MLGQVVHEQAGHLELVNEVALLVGRTGAIRVAVEEHAELVPVADDLRQRLVDVRADRLGVHAAEVRVALLVDLVDADATHLRAAG